MLLELDRVDKVFGGLHAVRSVSLHVAEKEIFGLIGPNGAGKTTLFKAISGVVTPVAGRILFEGEDITGLPSHARVLKGIVYTFQITSIFAPLCSFRSP